MIDIALLIACAPTVAHKTTAEIIRVESSANPIALNVNGQRIVRKPHNAADAAAMARQYISAGYTVDLGLMQVNSDNLKRLGYTVEEMFEPCKNIAAGARILTEFYRRAKTIHEDDQRALLAALSAYNTGNFNRGFSNGYVARYVGNRSVSHTTNTPILSSTKSSGSTAGNIPLDPFTASAVVYRRNKEDVMKQEEKTLPVVSDSEDDLRTPGVQVEYTAAEAEQMGAFQETAMSESDAWEANADLLNASSSKSEEASNEGKETEAAENGDTDIHSAVIMINGKLVY